MPIDETIDPTRAVLGPQGPHSFVAGFDYTLMPYSGCVFGCSYCYVPSVIGRSPAGRTAAANWGHYVKIRERAPAVIRARAADLAGKAIFLSATTDPYQPAERHHRVTRGVLEALADTDFRRLLISTRNPLLALALDLDLLTSPALRDRVEFGVSLTTNRESIRRVFERHNPPAAQRWDAIRSWHNAGVNTRLHVAPLLPYADSPAEFAAWLAATGASFIWFDDLNHSSAPLRAQFATIGEDAWLDPTHPAGQEAHIQAVMAALTARGIAVDRGSAGFVRGWDPARQALVGPAVWGSPLPAKEVLHADL